MGNIKSITESGSRVAENTDEITKNGIAISKNVETLTIKANELAEQAKIVLEKLQGFFDRVPSGGAIKGIQTEMSLLRDTDTELWRTDLTASIPVSDGKLHLGLFDAFENNRFIIQYGKSFGKADVRYGIYASKPSVGVDWRIAPRLSLRGDLYDLNDPTFDLRARYEFGGGLLGWFGVSDLWDRNSWILGVGIKK
jgi:phospholipid/cholesterol/gamma-HCH transport system substrate-binding protein